LRSLVFFHRNDKIQHTVSKKFKPLIIFVEILKISHKVFL